MKYQTQPAPFRRTKFHARPPPGLAETPTRNVQIVRFVLKAITHTIVVTTQQVCNTVHTKHQFRV